ncbi:Arylesterase [compost metagenome]
MQYYIKVEPGVNIFVNDLNPTASKTILFIHGWPVNSNMFEYQSNIIPQKGYRCIFLDIRGFGKSDKPIGGYDYNRIADDIRVVIDTLGIMDITLVGFSVGGAIAVKYMARHDGHGVSKLILAGAAAPSFTILPNFPYGHSKEETNTLIEAIYTDRPKMLDDFTSMFFYKQISKPFSGWFLDLGLKASSYGKIAVLESIRDEVLFEDLKKITKETLILHGKHDKVCPFALAEAMKKDIPNSTLIPFEESGHGLFYDEKDKFNEEILKFVH